MSIRFFLDRIALFLSLSHKSRKDDSKLQQNKTSSEFTVRMNCNEVMYLRVVKALKINLLRLSKKNLVCLVHV